MTNRPIEKKSAMPGDLSPIDDGGGVAGAKQYDRHGEEGVGIVRLTQRAT